MRGIALIEAGWEVGKDSDVSGGECERAVTCLMAETWVVSEGCRIGLQGGNTPGATVEYSLGLIPTNIGVQMAKEREDASVHRPSIFSERFAIGPFKCNGGKEGRQTNLM